MNWPLIHNNLPRNYIPEVANSQYRFLILLIEKAGLRVSSSLFGSIAMLIRLNQIVFFSGGPH